MNKGFELSLSFDDKYYMIGFIGFDWIGDLRTYTSSYHVVCARVLGLSYPDYLLYAQSLGAKLRGKKGYTYPVWESKKEAMVMCNKINEEWNKLVDNITF